MVSQKSVTEQLKRIGFNQHAWGRAEVRELPNIILPDEEIFECVNGTYEGGFALLVATDVRVLLIDKKPFNYLTVEDLRFDMINEIDYNHRAFGAYVDISTGSRDLKFRSYNQPRLRKLIGHVQHCMAESKKRQTSHQEDQNQHLEQINDRLQAYLMTQYQHQQELQNRLRDVQQGGAPAAPAPEPPRPSPELSDYLLAQSLMAQYQAGTQQTPALPAGQTQTATPPASNAAGGLYEDGIREVFGNRSPASPEEPPQIHEPSTQPNGGGHGHLHVPAAFTFDTNPLKIAYSKLPMALRNRKFGRPSLHAHSQSETAPRPQAS